jgi:hypothetical protein
MYNRGGLIAKTFTITNPGTDNPLYLTVHHESFKIFTLVQKSVSSYIISVFKTSQVDGSTPVQDIAFSETSFIDHFTSINASKSGVYIYTSSRIAKIISTVNGDVMWANDAIGTSISDFKSEHESDKYLLAMAVDNTIHMYHKTAAVCNFIFETRNRMECRKCNPLSDFETDQVMCESGGDIG